MEPNPDRFTSRRSTVYGQRGIVSTSQPLAAEAGIEILRKDGKAFDAAVAAAAALNVVEPISTGLGGDVFALYKTSDGDVVAMRACGGAPADATIQNVRQAVVTDDEYEVDQLEAVKMPKVGPHTVTVPGTARGSESTAAELGTESLSNLLQPAIRYATEGYPVSEVVSTQWKQGEELFETAHAPKAFFF